MLDHPYPLSRLIFSRYFSSDFDPFPNGKKTYEKSDLIVKKKLECVVNGMADNQLQLSSKRYPCVAEEVEFGPREITLREYKQESCLLNLG